MMLYVFFILIVLGLNIAQLVILIHINKNNLPRRNNVKVDTGKRHHSRIAKTSFESPLNPYEAYKDKSSNLYAARRQKGGIVIKEGN